MENFSLDFLLNPTLDIAKFNTLISSIKAGFDNLKPIDASILASSLSKVKPTIVGLVQGTDGLATGIGKAVTETTKLGKAGSLAASAFNFSNMMNSVNIISSAFGTVAQAGIDYESNLAAVSAITGFTGKELDVLGASARTLAKDFGGSANDQLKSFQGILSKLGPEMAKDSDALATYAKNVNVLSQASGDDAATTMNALTDSLLQMGLASGTPAQIANESTKAINILAASAQVGAAEIPQVAQALLASGVAAKGANMSLVDVNAAIQVLAVGGKTGAEAGTALRNVLGLMQKASGPAEAAMAKLGTSSKELGSLLTTQGLDVALAKLNDGMNKVGTDAEKNALMMEIFGTENAAAAGIMLQNTEKFAAFSQGIEKGMEGQGSAFEQAGIRMNTASSIISRIQANISDAFIGITQSVGQGITALIGASTQIAPLMMSFSGISQILPEGTFTNAMNSIKTFSTTIVSQLVPGLISQDIATKSVIFNTEALTLSNIRQSIVTKAGIALDYLKSTAIWQVVSGQMALNAAFLANPIGVAIAGAVALGGALYLLYDNVESVRNVFDNAWQVIKFGATQAWEVMKSFGSVLYDMGSLVFDVLLTPFKLAWGVISGVGEKILSIFGVTEGFGTDLSSIFTGIQSLASGVINVFNQVSAVIAGVSGVVGSIGESISTGIGQLLTLDFGGLYDTVMGAGDKAGAEFNNAFNEKMRTAKFDEAKRNIQTGLEIGEGISVKVKAQTDFSATIKAYEDAQSQMNALASKKASGGLTDAESKKFDELKIKANQYATDIQKIAPEAVKGFSAIVGANGEITNAYDINISKAKEFAKANDYTDSLNKQKEAVSKNVSQMAGTYSQQTNEVKRLQAELAKPVTDEKAYDKLRESFESATKQAEEMKNTMVENFLKAGEAGLVTDGAIQSVAKSLKMSNEDAKKMLLANELKKASESGIITDEIIGRIGAKYGYTKEQAKGVANESKNQTKNVQETKEEVKNLSEAWDSVVKSIKGTSEASKKQFVAGASYLELLKKSPALAKKMYDSADASGKKMFDNLASMGEAEAKSYLANGLAQAKQDKIQQESMEKTIKANEALVEGKKEDTKEQKKANKEAKSAYELLKDKFALEEKNLQAIKEQSELKRESSRLELGITTSAKQANLDKLRDLQSEKSILELRKKNTLALIESNSKNSKDKQAQLAETVKLNDELNKIDSSIIKIGNESLKINATVGLNDKEFQKEVAKIQSDTKRKEIEFKVKIGELPASDLTRFDISDKLINKDEIQKQLDEVKAQFAKNLIMGYDNTETITQIKTLEQTQKDSTYAIYENEKTLREQNEKERLENITDFALKTKETTISEAKKAYDADLILAQNNIAKKLIAENKYELARNKAEQDYLISSNLSLKAISKLSNAFSTIKFSPVNNDGIINAKKTQADIAKQKEDLRKSYDAGKIDYEKYQEDLTSLQQKESDARIALEQAESDKRKAIWNGFSTAVGSVFGELAVEYKDKFVTSLTDSQATIGDVFANLAVYSGAMFGQLIADHENFGRSALKTALAVAKAIVPVLTVQILGEEFVKSGPLGAITAAAMSASLYGFLSLAESAVNGAFFNGVVNYKGKGSGTSDSNIVRISNGESVITAKATSHSINQKFFDYANKTGGDLFSYIRADKSLQQELADRNALDYYSDIEKRSIHLEYMIEEHKQNNKSLEKQNKELVAEIKKLGDRFEMIMERTTLVETKHAFNINATNNVINQVEKADLWRR